MDAKDMSVKGFRFASCAAGIKKKGKLDLALIVSDKPAQCAGVFTRNKVVAAPVVLSRAVTERGCCQAILVNSGNANACTGAQGASDAQRCAELAAEVLEMPLEQVVVSSTGVIGVPLPMGCFERSVPALTGQLSVDGASSVAEAIMTTDSYSKMATQRIERREGSYTILGIAKGAGMIHPDMATMLAFVLCDAEVEQDLLRQALTRCIEKSFNSITVDGDTSTNDMVLVLANGEAGGEKITAGSAAAEEFEAALQVVLIDLAKMIVRDGEGATKLVEVSVQGALDDEQARTAARAVATSSLVKTAFFGEDANWGRIIAAVGYSGAEIDEAKATLCFEDAEVYRFGVTTGPEAEARASEVLKRPEFKVIVDLGLGNGCASYYTSDLSYDYVRINADYRT